MKKWQAKLLLIMLLAGNVQAAEKQSAAVQITLELGATCRLDADALQGFGAWPTSGENLSGVALGSITVSCAANMPYAVGIDAGQNYDGTNRRMKNDTAYVPYVLRASSSNGPEWGDTGLNAIVSNYMPTHPGLAVQGTGTGSAQTFSVWGEADIANAPAGTYSDNVTITLAW